MNISLSPQSFYTPNIQKKNKPAFTSNIRQVADAAPNFTYFFRGDFEWINFAGYLGRKYKNADKVNVYNAGCSDGSETFTLVMSLLAKLGKEKAEKFLPIEAFDINKQLIKDANTGLVPLLPQPYTIIDIFKLKVNMLFRDHKFLNYSKINGKRYVQMNDTTKSRINFKEGNIFNEIDKMQSSNSVVMCRNMWLYLNDIEQTKLAQKLGSKLDKSSIVVLGDYDLNASKAVELLNKNGFEETYVDKVYEKMF